MQQVLIILVLTLGFLMRHGLPWYAAVDRVSDGDSLVSKGRRIRIHGIDAPEINYDDPRKTQPGGFEAKAFVERTIGSKKAIFWPTCRTDAYGRVVARVFVDGRSLGAAIVRSGNAWGETFLLGLASIPSRILRRGIWANRDRVHPREWRRENPYVR